MKPGCTSTLVGGILNKRNIESHIHPISCKRLAVATKSIQKNRPYLKSSLTLDMMSSSLLKSISAIVSAAKKKGSESLKVTQSLI